MPDRVSSNLCAQCKGARRLCGRPRCPILERLQTQLALEKEVQGNDLFGSSPPSVLVGEFDYPKIRVGAMVPPTVDDKLAQLHDNPPEWYGKTIEEIIGLRSRLIRSNFVMNAEEASKQSVKLLDSVQEMALSSSPVDAEVQFYKPPQMSLGFDGVIPPIGPTGNLKALNLVQNPTVPRKVDQLVYDKDAKAYVAVKELFNAGISNYYITRLLTIGLLGQRRERRLVPTRWGITAVDNMLGDSLLEKVKDNSEINEILLYLNSYLDNHYFILYLPGSYAFEMIEIWLPRSVWVRDEKSYVTENFELYDGKWRRENGDGGYKAMRMAVIEHLHKINRQATAFTIREVGSGYYAPLGVWNVREGMRHAFDGEPMRFGDVDEAIQFMGSKLKTPFNDWYEKVQLPKMYKFQKKISQYSG